MLAPVSSVTPHKKPGRKCHPGRVLRSRAPDEDVVGLRSTVEEEIPSGEIGKEWSPELWINRRGWIEETYLYSFIFENVGIQEFPRWTLGQELRGPGPLAYLYQKAVA